jgi:hypothetical protein
MTDWQNWIVIAVALWCAYRVISEVVRPFLTSSCTGCGGTCEEEEKREELIEIN